MLEYCKRNTKSFKYITYISKIMDVQLPHPLSSWRVLPTLPSNFRRLQPTQIRPSPAKKLPCRLQAPNRLRLAPPPPAWKQVGQGVNRTTTTKMGTTGTRIYERVRGKARRLKRSTRKCLCSWVLGQRFGQGMDLRSV